MKTNIVVTALILAVCCLIQSNQRLHGEEKKLEERKNEKVKPKAKLDYEKLVADLVNHNPEPKDANVDHERATFAKDYDWNEMNRIDRSLQILIDNFDESWPTLVKHQNDKEYCLTAHHCTSTDYDSNYSVGSFCKILLADNLVESYIDFIPSDKNTFQKLQTPDFIKYDSEDADKAGQWYRQQLERKREFYEMQIEANQWAISKISGLTKYSSDAEKKKSIAEIKKQVETLQKEKKPILIKKFNKGDGWRVVVTHERAKK